MRSNTNKLLGSLAVVLALAAIGTPAAIANSTNSTANLIVRPNPDEQAVASLAASSHPASPVVRPNPDEQTVTSTPSLTRASCGDVCSGHGYGPVHVVTPILTIRPVSTTAHNGGFDWGDAGIGAGVAFALTLAGLAGVLATTRRRSHPTRSTVSPTT